MIKKAFEIPSFAGSGSDAIRGDVFIAEGPPPRTAVVVVHGFKGFKDFAFFPHLAEQLARRGHAAISFNFSCNGIGDDPMVFDRLDDFGRNTFSRELDELGQVIGRVLDGDLLPRRPDRVGLVGHSRGGGISILRASEDDRVDGLVTWGSVANFDRWTEETLAEWRRDGRIHVVNGRTGQHMPLDLTLLEDFEANRERLDIEAAASRVTAPWLILHGEDDMTVRMEDAERLARANPDARLVAIEKAGHTFEAKHPFERVPPELSAAIDLTCDHFRLIWSGD